MQKNTKLAILTSSVIASLTILISCGPTIPVTLLGGVILLVGFGLLSKLDESSRTSSATGFSYLYVIPMIIGPASGGILRDVALGPLYGVFIGLACGAAAYWLIMKFPTLPDETTDEDYARLPQDSTR